MVTLASRKEQNVLWLIWQDPKTRLRHVVGKLWLNDNDSCEFAYQKNGFRVAESKGFRVLPSLPDCNMTYQSSKLFSVFARRLPDKRRPDYQKILEGYGLPPESSEFDILAKTGGKLATDNFEFVTSLESCSNLPFKHELFLAGWKYWGGAIGIPPEELIPGTILKIIPEPENQFDKFALQVFTTAGKKIGYVPSFYSNLVSHYIADGCNCYLEVLGFNSTEESSNVLKLKLVCDGKCPKRREILVH